MKGIYYIEALPEDIRLKWKGNLTKCMIEIWNKHNFENISRFLEGTIMWEESNEGFEYWNNIRMNDKLLTTIERHTKLKNLGI